MMQLTAFLKRHVLSIGSEFRSLGAQTEKDLYPYILRLSEGNYTTVSKQIANYAIDSKALGEHLSTE